MPANAQSRALHVRLFGNRWLEAATLTPFPVFLGAWMAILTWVAVESIRHVAAVPGIVSV